MNDERSRLASPKPVAAEAPVGSVRRSAFIVPICCTAAFLLTSFLTGDALACPFCVAIKPTLAQKRENASVVLLAEAAAARDGKQTFLVHHVIRDEGNWDDRKDARIGIDSPLPAGTLALAFGSNDEASAGEFEWTVERTNEVAAAYFAKAPGERVPAAQRLAYFARYLEHPDPLIAEDAYSEFGHAPYDDVVRVADKFEMRRVRQWIEDPQVPEARKGFYGLVLGMARNEADRAANRKLLEARMQRPETDFRSGFDGVLAGYLLLRDKEGLRQIESRYIADAKAAHGDTRHAHQALRFYWEFGPQEHRGAVAAVVARLVDRPPFAAAAITDLTRWQHWEAAEKVAGLSGRRELGDRPIRQAIVAYLMACPLPQAAEALAQMRAKDPEGVAEAERWLSTAPAGK